MSASLQAAPSLSLTTLWRSPTLTIARFMLKSHIRSGWILGDIVFIWFLYAAFFFRVWWGCGLLLWCNEPGSVRPGSSQYDCDDTACNDCAYVSSTLAALFAFSLHPGIDCGYSLSTRAIFLACPPAGTELP